MLRLLRFLIPHRKLVASLIFEIVAGCLNQLADIAMREVQCHSGREHKHGACSAERWGVISAPLRGGAECAVEFVIETAAGEF